MVALDREARVQGSGRTLAPAHHPHAAALSLAAQLAGDAGPRAAGRDPASHRRQGGERLCADPLQGCGRYPLGRDGGGHRRAGGDPVGLRRAPGAHGRLRRTQGCGLRQGRGARDPNRSAAGLQPSPRAFAPLPHRAPHRGPEPRHRARRQGNRVPAHLHAVQHPADPGGGHHGLRHPLGPLRRHLRCDHLRHHRLLYRLHPHGHRMASEVPPAHEREGQRGQHQGDRQPAQLRDGQVFRQRDARGAALRHLPPAVRTGGGAEQDQPLAAQHRPGDHHRHRAHRHHDHGGLRGRRRHHDHRRLRAGQHVPAPALHPA